MEALGGHRFHSEAVVLGLAEEDLTPEGHHLARLEVQGKILHHRSANSRRLWRWPLALGANSLLRRHLLGVAGLAAQL